ncbi:MAG: response regulator [Verrucomicrobiaceae bacterium]|nr:response regulator [Verrucomicrobiaceae bacterium]
MTIAAIAKGAGFETRLCSEPDDFFNAVSQWQPTHITVDLVMPNIDGVEVLRLLAEHHCQAQVIVTSGEGTQTLESAQAAAQQYGLGAVKVLSKPFRPRELRALIQSN